MREGVAGSENWLSASLELYISTCAGVFAHTRTFGWWNLTKKGQIKIIEL